MGTSHFSFVRLRRFAVMVRFLLGTSAWTGNANLGSGRENLRLTKVLARAESTLASAASGLNASSSKTPGTAANESCSRTAPPVNGIKR
jgi:hypothetical protein